MLADTGIAHHLNRPRPPSNRRSSAAKVKASTSRVAEDIEEEENKDPARNLTRPDAAIRRASDSSAGQGRSIEMDEDLGLDLPFDLAALHRSSQSRTVSDPRVRQSSATSKGNRRDQVTHNGDDAGDGTILQQDYDALDMNHPTSPRDAEAETQWMGDLPREELEQLLLQANEVIRERERDLGIAAAIGKALLEKNISLRSKHEGIMYRLSSVNSFSQLAGDDADEEPRYSPPTTDVDTSIDLDDVTPRPSPAATNGFFEGLPMEDGVDSPRKTTLAHLSNISTPSKERADSERFDSWGSRRQDCFVPSIPPSPSESVIKKQREDNHARLQFFSNETQRQLEMLSDQNEILLEQLAELQTEAEEAKKDGGRRLKKLNQEIDGLRGELEAATERNVELEKGASHEGKGSRSSPEVEQQTGRVWRRQGQHLRGYREQATIRSWRHIGDDTAGSIGIIDTDEEDKPPSKPDPSSEEQTIPSRSESMLSITSQSGKGTLSESERAVIAQLLAKIKELEETNASLALAGTEMDGRIGKAMEEGERIRDAYEAVENTAGMSTIMENVTQLRREDSGITSSTMSTGSPFSASDMSPSQARRRAPGNRYIIEGKRTLRAALRGNYSTRSGRDEPHYHYDSSASSPDPSPIKGGRSQRKTLRPRILITPSCDDLQARAREDAEEEAAATACDGVESPSSMRTRDDLDSPMKMMERSTSTPLISRHYRFSGASPSSSTRDPFGSLSSVDSMAALPFDGRRSLQSELGSVFGGDLDSIGGELPDASREENDAPVFLSELKRDPSYGSFRLHSRASINSLRAASEAESDIADLTWTGSNDVKAEAPLSYENVEQKLLQSSVDSDITVNQLALVPRRGSLADTTVIAAEEETGLWLTANDQDVLPKGSLRNEVESSGENYEWIEAVTQKLPVHWADDDDFGKPITEKEARKLDLLQGQKALGGSQTTSGLLSWVSGKRGAVSHRGKESAPATARPIESTEDYEDRMDLEALLREKRVIALRNRVISGQISMDRGKRIGVVEQSETWLGDRFEDPSLEEEITARAFAYSSIRQRKLLRQQQRQEQESRRRGKGGKYAHKAMDTLEGEESSDEAFELLDLDASKRRPGRKGTDYYPITLKERYKPKVVKQRVNQFSSETITWALAWASFSLVMVFAFLVTFSRGPKRVLNGQKK